MSSYISPVKNLFTSKAKREAKQKFEQKMAEAAERVKQRKLNGDPQVNALLEQAQNEVHNEAEMADRLLKLQLPNIPGRTDSFTRAAAIAPKTEQEQVNSLLKEEASQLLLEKRFKALQQEAEFPAVLTHLIR